MIVNNLSNLNFRADFRINGIANGSEINEKYSDAIQQTRDKINEKRREIDKLNNEIIALSNQISQIHLSRALQLQALNYINRSDVKDRISQLPDDLVLEMMTTSACACTPVGLAEAPSLNLYVKKGNENNSDYVDMLKAMYIFRMDENHILDKNSVEEWVDGI